MPKLTSDKLGWDGAPSSTLFDPEPGFRWVKFTTRKPGCPPSELCAHRVPVGASPDEVREAIVWGCKVAPTTELKILLENEES